MGSTKAVMAYGDSEQVQRKRKGRENGRRGGNGGGGRRDKKKAEDKAVLKANANRKLF